MCDFNCRQTTWSQLTSHLCIPDFLGEVGLNFALNLVTSCCGCKTAGARVNELWWPKALGWDFQNDTIVSFKINTFFSNPSFTCRRLDSLWCDTKCNIHRWWNRPLQFLRFWRIRPMPPQYVHCYANARESLRVRH